MLSRLGSKAGRILRWAALVSEPVESRSLEREVSGRRRLEGVGNGTEGAMDLPMALLLNEVGKVLGTLHLRRAYPLARIAYLQ